MAEDKPQKSEPVKEIVETVRNLRKAVDSARETIREIADERGGSDQGGAQ